MATTGLRFFTARTNDNIGAPILDDNNSEVLMHSQEGVSIVLGSRLAEASGTLYITSKQVIWLSDVDVSKGYAVDFVSITLHAISRDPEGYPSPCIYTQIETGDDGDDDEDDDEGPSEISKTKEMRLVPSDPNQLETLFNVFCEGAELNPEPMAMEGGDEEEHNWIFSADQLNADTFSNGIDEDFIEAIGHSNGDHDLAHNVLQLQINDHRFEDAEEMEDETSSAPQ
ncbi:hypothetical protein KSS87_018488 [Heliosperma pusillum]|nr:hypothetical protein KSS87_018488 [Heliosperma pusillum]